MSSSTSSSEQGTKPAGPDARKALRWVAYGLVAALLASLAFILATDPYDRGHRNLIGDRGVPEYGQPLRNAGIARQQGYDSALIGNSTFQLINPTNVGRLAGSGRFVSLTMLGARPLEILAMAERFRATHGGRVQALVVGIDQSWCQPDAPVMKGRPFPFWLYGASARDYLAGVLRLDSLRHGVVRIAMALGRSPRMSPDGFEDYEPALGWQRELAERAVTAPREVAHYHSASATFPALARLERFLAEIGLAPAAVLVILPRHRASIPMPGSNEFDLESACRARLAQLAANRPRTVVIDHLRNDARAAAIENWWDYTHYRGGVAREIEIDIATALRGLQAQ